MLPMTSDTAAQKPSTRPSDGAMVRDYRPRDAFVRRYRLVVEGGRVPLLSVHPASCCLMPLDRIGRYHIKRMIGQGGMGVVYAAHDDRLDRLVAIKVVRPEALAADGARERFRREARAAARVSHPHICPLYEFDEDNGQPFLVMELLDGEPLAVRLAARGDSRSMRRSRWPTRCSTRSPPCTAAASSTAISSRPTCS